MKRTDSAFGSSKASTIATVCPVPSLADGRLYADCKSLGVYPEGDCEGRPVRTNDRQRTSAGLPVSGQTARARTGSAAPFAGSGTAGDLALSVAQAGSSAAAISRAKGRANISDI